MIRQICDFPCPLPAQKVTISPLRIPRVMVLSPSNGYGMLSVCFGLTKRSWMSEPETIASGLHGLAWKIACITSLDLLLAKHSLASFSGRRATLAFPAGRIPTTSSTALRPGSSSSNIRITSSHFSSHRRFFLNTLAADCDPVGRETTAYLFSCIWLTLKASTSPSVTTNFLPPIGCRCCP